MVALYVTSALILVRSIVRVVEYLDGYDGYLMRHEVFIYVFDALLMFLAVTALHIVHPSQVNALLDRGDIYMEKVVMTRKSVRGPPVEMHGAMC